MNLVYGLSRLILVHSLPSFSGHLRLGELSYFIEQSSAKYPYSTFLIIKKIQSYENS